MPTLHIAMKDVLLIARESTGTWTLDEYLSGIPLQCVAVDPEDGGKIYVGTEDRGVCRSLDGGRTWLPTGPFGSPNVTAITVGNAASGDPGVVYVGTEPSAVFRSTDAGETWDELDGLESLPSASAWSFPPRPDTHHVRWIAIDPHDPRQIHVAIEAGALVRSGDGGDTWIDRTRQSPYDTHTLALHPVAPNRLYSAAGDGYYESRDGGRTWRKAQDGLRHGYLFGVAVDPADPDRVVVSAAPGPFQAYSAASADTHLYVKDGEDPWTPVQEGLPEPRGTTISVLATTPTEPHAIYAANNRGLFHSRDGGSRWERLGVRWPEGLHCQSARALALAS